MKLLRARPVTFDQLLLANNSRQVTLHVRLFRSAEASRERERERERKRERERERERENVALLVAQRLCAEDSVETY